jgi:dTDP-4-amino-4,6-dideoxygalactose transaminase
LAPKQWISSSRIEMDDETRAALGSQRPAFAGGDPVFKHTLRLSEPTLPDLDDFHASLADIWERRWLSNHGPLARRLSERIAERVNVPHVVPAASGTAGLTAVLMALGVRGDVVVPAYTFAATAQAVFAAGATPVFADVCSRSWALVPETVTPRMGPRVEAIVAVHPFGMPCEHVGLEALADRYGLALVFDAAHAFGSRYPEGLAVGAAGHAEVFSFHATKMLAMGEGGAICTHDPGLAARCRRALDYGRNVDQAVIVAGFNGKLQEFNAALGLSGIDRVDGWIQRRASCVRTLRRALHGVDGIFWPEPASTSGTNHQYAALRIDAKRFGLNADMLQKALAAENIDSRRYFSPALHLAPAFSNRCDTSRQVRPHLPVSEGLARESLCLPLYSHLPIEVVPRVAWALIRIRNWWLGHRGDGFKPIGVRRDRSPEATAGGPQTPGDLADPKNGEEPKDPSIEAGLHDDARDDEDGEPWRGEQEQAG